MAPTARRSHRGNVSSLVPDGIRWSGVRWPSFWGDHTRASAQPTTPTHTHGHARLAHGSLDHSRPIHGSSLPSGTMVARIILESFGKSASR
eukprot:scaffold4391_cov120-Isochrysis_galbana.AAC.3